METHQILIIYIHRLVLTATAERHPQTDRKTNINQSYGRQIDHEHVPTRLDLR